MRRSTIVLGLLVVVAAAGLAVLGSGKGSLGHQRRPELVVAVYSSEEGDAIASLAGRYEAADITIVALPYEALRQRLRNTVAGDKSIYDVVAVDDPWMPELGPHLLELRDLPPSLVDDLIPACLRLGRDPFPDGPIKGLPWTGNTLLLFYRKDLLEAAGYSTPPATWDGLLEAAEKVEKASPGVAGFSVMTKPSTVMVTGFLPILWSDGSEILAEEHGRHDRVVLGRSDLAEQTAHAIRQYARQVELSPPGSLEYDRVESTASFIAGASAMELNWPVVIDSIESRLPRRADGSRIWGIAAPPDRFGRVASVAGLWFLSVPQGARDPRAARDFIVWLLEHQKDAALMGNPPTRRSVYTALGGEAQFFYFPVLERVLEDAIPRPRTPHWDDVETAIARELTFVLAGSRDPDRATAELQDQLERIVEPSPSAPPAPP